MIYMILQHLQIFAVHFVVLCCDVSKSLETLHCNLYWVSSDLCGN